VATIIEIARSQVVGDMSAASPMQQSLLFAACPSVVTSKAANGRRSGLSCFIRFPDRPPDL